MSLLLQRGYLGRSAPASLSESINGRLSVHAMHQIHLMSTTVCQTWHNPGFFKVGVIISYN